MTGRPCSQVVWFPHQKCLCLRGRRQWLDWLACVSVGMKYVHQAEGSLLGHVYAHLAYWLGAGRVVPFRVCSDIVRDVSGSLLQSINEYETLRSLKPEAYHTLVYQTRCVCILVIAILRMPLRLSIYQRRSGRMVRDYASYHLEQLFFLRHRLSVVFLGCAS